MQMILQLLSRPEEAHREARHKTELLLITGHHIRLHMDMTIGNEVIRTKSSVRYLGIRLDPRLIYSYQIQYSANKAQKIVGQLNRLMTNIGWRLQTALYYMEAKIGPKR